MNDKDKVIYAGNLDVISETKQDYLEQTNKFDNRKESDIFKIEQ